MIGAAANMTAFTDDSSVLDDNGADGRVRPRMAAAPGRQLKGAPHEILVPAFLLLHGGGRHSADAGFFEDRDLAYLSRIPFTIFPLWESE